MDRNIGYSYTRTIMNSSQICGTDHAYIYIIFEKLNARLQVRKENGVKLFEWFGINYTIPTG